MPKVGKGQKAVNYPYSQKGMKDAMAHAKRTGESVSIEYGHGGKVLPKYYGGGRVGGRPMGRPMARPGMAGRPTNPMGRPSMGRPSMGGGMRGRPGMGRPGMGRPGMGRPGMGRPGMGRPGMGRPMARPIMKKGGKVK